MCFNVDILTAFGWFLSNSKKWFVIWCWLNIPLLTVKSIPFETSGLKVKPFGRLSESRHHCQLRISQLRWYDLSVSMPNNSSGLFSTQHINFMVNMFFYFSHETKQASELAMRLWETDIFICELSEFLEQLDDHIWTTIADSRRSHASVGHDGEREQVRVGARWDRRHLRLCSVVLRRWQSRISLFSH